MTVILACVLLSLIFGALAYLAMVATDILRLVQQLRAMADHPAGRAPLDPRW